MELQLQPGTLPSNCYPANPQQLYVAMFSRGVALQPDILSYIKSETEPTPENRDKVWVKVDGTGQPTGVFVYSNGFWIWRHEIPAASSYRALYVGDITSLLTFDGGNVGSAPYAGPFWEVDTDFAGRSPMAPGEIPTANPAKTLSVNENYGEGAHMMSSEEVGPHTHVIDRKLVKSGSGAEQGIEWSEASEDLVLSDIPTLPNEYTSTQQGMPVIHPVRGVYIIKRTARVYRTP